MGKFDSIDTTTKARSTKSGVYVASMNRHVKSYQVLEIEWWTISIANPIGAGLLSWGISMSCEWAGMEDGRPKHMLGVASLGLILVGLAFIVGTWVWALVIRKQST